MTPYRPGAVVLVHFPFTRLHATKKRPALVLSPAAYTRRHGDVVVLALTSRPQEPSLALQHWETAGLLGPTWVKPTVFSLAESIIDRQIGTLAPQDTPHVTAALHLLIDGHYLP